MTLGPPVKVPKDWFETRIYHSEHVQNPRDYFWDGASFRIDYAAGMGTVRVLRQRKIKLKLPQIIKNI